MKYARSARAGWPNIAGHQPPPSGRADTSCGGGAVVAMVRVELSDPQWGAIQQASGLPESARERIEHLLEYY